MASGVNFLAPDVCSGTSGQGVSVQTTHNSHTHGFTYCGTCSNPNCKAHTEYDKDGDVSHKMRMQSTIRPNEDEMTGVIVCQLCKTPFIPSTYIMRNCSVKIDFKYAGQGQKMHTVTWTTGKYQKDSYFYLKLGNEGERMMYSAVMINVAEHQVYPNSDPNPALGIFDTYIDPLNKQPNAELSPNQKKTERKASIELSPFNVASKQLDSLLPRLKFIMEEAEQIQKRLSDCM